ncbi:MAG: hypothetical protein R3C53_19965 [Pirellulaceae bacterium]
MGRMLVINAAREAPQSRHHAISPLEQHAPAGELVDIWKYACATCRNNPIQAASRRQQ